MRKTAHYLLDTNVLIRFLTADNKEYFEKARALFNYAQIGTCELVVTDILIAEAVWVLTSPSLYKLNRSKVAEKLSSLLIQPGIRSENRDILLDSLGRFKKTTLDFFDCYLAAKSFAHKLPIASFDKGFKKFADVEII